MIIAEHITGYADRLARLLKCAAMSDVTTLAEALRECWISGHSVYLCGNGGSAANAVHIANDWLYVARSSTSRGFNVEALTANVAVLTSIANDLGYDRVFEEQLKAKARAGDVLVVLSGSGNSLNVVRALEMGTARGMKTFAILGYSGGAAKTVAQHPIHFEVDDMQVAEDLQLVVGHMCMQWLCAHPVDR